MYPELIATSRLLLRRPHLDLAEQVFCSYGRDPRVTRFLSWPTSRSVADTQQFLGELAKRTERREELAWAIFERRESQLLGMIGVRRSPPAAEVGYCLAYEAWGQGYAAEAMQAVLPHIWDDGSIHRIHAFCHAKNLRSSRVLEKSGMRYASLERGHSVLPALGLKPQDMLRYETLRPKGT